MSKKVLYSENLKVDFISISPLKIKRDNKDKTPTQHERFGWFDLKLIPVFSLQLWNLLFRIRK